MNEFVNWYKEHKTKFCVAVLSVVTGAWLVIGNQLTVEPPECVCESCAIECSEACEICEVKIENGVRIVCRGDKCYLYPIETEGELEQTEEVDKIDQ